MTQEEACAALDVRKQTLYAYVSRGQIAVRRDLARVGRNQYSASDILTLLEKRRRGRARTTIAASTMAWGEPIVDTHISTVVRGRLYYRGHDAVRLSKAVTLEEIARSLWQSGPLPDRASTEPTRGRQNIEMASGRASGRAHAVVDQDGPSDTAPYFAGVPHGLAVTSPIARAYAALALAASEGLASNSQGFPGMHAEAARLVGALASGFVRFDARTVTDARPLHERLADAWDAAAHADLLRQALVLLADQELTTSAFAARVAASTGASLGACALAGLAALSGPLHGGAPARVRAFLDEARRDGVENRVLAAIGDGDPTAAPLSGFGHPLYPQGDPRAVSLLAAFPVPDSIRDIIACVDRHSDRKPTIDVALVALVEYCKLPNDAAFALFAIARSVGWMAHAIEQVSSGTLLRPRAHYIGPKIIEEPIS